MRKERYIICGQKIDAVKLERAKELRRKLTPAERNLWNVLRRGQLDGLHFRRQQVIDGFIVDFYCHAVGLVIEVDGAIHDRIERREYDAERERILDIRGLKVLRVKNEDVMDNLEEVIERIREACDLPNAGR